MPNRAIIFYKKPNNPKEILPFADNSVKKIPYQKNSIYIDKKGRTWHSTKNPDIVYTLEGFLYEIKRKRKLTLVKILDYWD